MNTYTGHIVSIRGLIVEVSFQGDGRPELREVMTIEGHPEVLLEIQSFNERSDAICISFMTSTLVRRGAKVVSTGTTIAVPTGAKSLGRLFNSVGQPADNLEEIG